jgi:heat shock protein HslJ
VVADNTVTVLTGTKTERQCDAARMRGDDELLADLTQATSWSRNGDVITLQGGKTLRFRQLTN